MKSQLKVKRGLKPVAGAVLGALFGATLAMAAGAKIVLPPPHIQEESQRLWRDMREQPDIRDPDRSLEWQAIVRLVERIAPDYRT